MENRRFEDWTAVDCNECAKYWDSSCDGVKCGTNSDKSSTGSTRLCNSFLPTRSVVIPAQIKRLEKGLKWLAVSCLCANLAIVIHLLCRLLGWL